MLVLLPEFRARTERATMAPDAKPRAPDRPRGRVARWCVDKPAGLVVHPAPSVKEPTLVDWLGERAGGGEGDRPGIVQRLDKDTSGLMVVARDEATSSALSAQIKAREVAREYLALVEGTLDSRTGTIDAPLGRDRRRRTRRAVRGSGEREARTHFEVIERLPADTYAAREARDWPHAPDPGPFRRHRPSRRRGPGVRGRGTPRPRAPVPARGAARLPAPGHRPGSELHLRAAAGPRAGAGPRPGRLMRRTERAGHSRMRRRP